MAITPTFKGPDGVYRTTFTYSTDTPYQFLSGVCDADTADMQVAIRSNDFQSDPDLIAFEGTSFIIPNPSAYPEGLTLLPGSNQIQVRSILTNGDATGSALANLTLSLERDVRAGIIAPSDISVERKDRMVVISVRGSTDTNITGYNFWGSASPGGGLTGYYRINPVTVSTGTPEEVLTPLGLMTIDAEIAVNPDGTPVADPTYIQMLGVETSRPVGTDVNGSTLSISSVIKTDYFQALQVPDDVTRVKTTLTVESVDQIQTFSFTHDRRSIATSSQNPAIPNSEFLSLQDSDPIYYVVSAIYFIDGQQYESPFSPEVAAAPLIVTPVIASLPSVSHQQLVQDTTLSIFRTHPEIDVKPGSVYRDTFIDPVATEEERIRFIIGFLQNCQAFATLLAIDDPGYTGSSLPVSQSPYKQALKTAFFLQSDQDVQNIIDNAFDRLAATRGQQRRPGKRARGEVTVYVTTRPTTTYYIPIGSLMSGGSVTVRATSAGQITSAGAGSSYNPSTGRYSTTVFVQADQPGATGNLAPGQIRSIQGAASGLQVTNEASLFGGRNAESNRDLAARCDGVLSAVDSGTSRGLFQRAVDVPGVQEVNIVGGGHDLMMRDLDDAGRHTGGKVDIWLRGSSTAIMTDRFAFSFELVTTGEPGSQFEPVGQLADLKFRVINPKVNSENPIIEMIDNPAWGYVFKDMNTGKVFDLTDAVVIFPDGIQLSATYNNPLGISVTDSFMGTYRFRTSNKHVFVRQPAGAIQSLEGDQTGLILSTDYALYSGSLPLELGQSIEAGSYIQVTEDAPVPSAQALIAVGESHVILDRTEYLLQLGINPITVRVWDTTRTTEYYGPYHPSAVKDFSFIAETGESPLALYLTVNSRIQIGWTVLVDYEYDENFTVTYTVNSMVGNVQNAIEPYRHITSDILAKEALSTGVDMEATIALVQGQTQNKMDGPIRTALARAFGALGLGQSFRQSDFVDVVKSVTGVSYVVLPLTKLAKSDRSIIAKEDLFTSDVNDFLFVTSWSTPVVDVYLLKNPLISGTLHSGGNPNDPRGVSYSILDSNLVAHVTEMSNYASPPNANGVPIREVPNCAFIIGNPGLWIPGYSDDATLRVTYPFASDEELNTHRIEITANRVLAALPKGQSPRDADFQVAYVVYGDTGVKNIEPGPVEYLQLGNLNFVYDEDTKAKRV